MKALNDWLSTFVKLILKPVPGTFREEAKRAEGKFAGAIGWLLLVVMLTHTYFILVSRLFYEFDLIVLSFVLFPFGVLLFVFGLHKLSQKWFHVEANHYSAFLYLTVAAIVPCFLLNFVLALIPRVGAVLSYVIILYPIVLAFLAVKALTLLKGWQVLIVVVVSLLFALVGMLVIPFFLAGVISNLGAVL